MTWRAASVGTWTRSVAIALVSAVGLVAPARAQLARMQASPNAPKLLVVPFGKVTPADSDVANEIADRFRDRIRLAHNDDFAVILKRAMCEALEQSGFSCTTELEPTQVGQLANVMNARFIADGRLFSHGDSLLVLVRLVQAVRTNPMGASASITVPRAKLSGSIGDQLADRIADKFRSFEYITRCRSERESKNYDRALDAARRALRYDAQSGGAYLCMALALQDQGGSPDSVQAALERAHDADSLNTTVARQLAVMYQDKRDTTNLIHMLRHIVAVDLNDNDLRKALAQLLVIRGHGDSAVMLLDEALARNPNQFDILLVKAIALGAQSKFDSAGLVMGQAAEVDSTKVDSSFISRTQELYERGGDSTRLLDWVRRGTVKVPTWTNNLYRYATMLLGKADTAGALAAVKEFMDKVPGDGRGHLVYATLLGARGQDDSALAHARMAGQADSNYRGPAAGIILRTAVKAFQGPPPNYARADTLFGQAQEWATGDAQKTAQFYRGVSQFQEGYAQVQAAQDAYKRFQQKDQSAREPGCAAVRSATDFLTAAEPNITGGAAANRDMANQLLGYLPTLRTALTQLGGNRALKCGS